MKPYTWVKVLWFGEWFSAWVKRVCLTGVYAELADDAPARFFPWEKVKPS